MGKTVRKSFNGRNLQHMTRVTKGLCVYKNSEPKGLSAPAQGLYTCIKSLKMYIKSDFEEIILKLATNGQSDKILLLTSGLCPQRVICPCPGAIYMYKIIKNVYKTRFRRDHFETCNIGQREKTFLLS